MIWLWGKIAPKLALAAAAIAAIGAALAAAFLKGRKRQRKADEAEATKVEAAAAETARQTYVDASKAAAGVREQAKAQPAPDVVKRDDLDNSF